MKTLPKWAFGVLSFVGVALIGSMFLSWIDIFGRTSGLGLAWEQNHWLFLVPVAGGVLVAAVATKSPYTRLAAIVAGLVVTGYVMFDLTRSIVHAGLDTWLILGGAGTMLAGVPNTRKAWRFFGGLMVLAGFVAPWVDYSMFKMLRHDLVENGVSNVLWAVPVGGVLGLLSAGASDKEGSRLARLGGGLVYGSLLLVIGLVAYVVFGMGAWIALGASATSLVIGVLVRDTVPGSPESE